MNKNDETSYLLNSPENKKHLDEGINQVNNENINTYTESDFIEWIRNKEN